MEWLYLVSAAVLFILGAGCVVLVAFGLPGTWILLGLALLLEFLIDPLYLPDERQPTFSMWVLVACFVLAALGELFEWIAGALGVKAGGGSQRGMWGAIVGGLLGAILFTPVFGFLPVVGTLAGALVGTFLGAMVGELSAHEPPRARQTIRPAAGATVGRVLGTAGKVAVVVTMWLVLSVAAFWT